MFPTGLLTPLTQLGAEGTTAGAPWVSEVLKSAKDIYATYEQSKKPAATAPMYATPPSAEGSVTSKTEQYILYGILGLFGLLAYKLLK